MNIEQTKLLNKKIKELERLENTIERKLNILKSVQLLLVDNKKYIKEIADEIGLSTYSIQRYLKNDVISKELGKEIQDEIDKRLLVLRHNGNIKGAKAYVKRNIATKEYNGKFNGSIPRE